jgi:acyl dehydratase
MPWPISRAGSDPTDALYFEDVEVGDKCTAGPYLVTKSEIVRFARQYDPVPENIDEAIAARSISEDLPPAVPMFSRSMSC